MCARVLRRRLREAAGVRRESRGERGERGQGGQGRGRNEDEGEKGEEGRERMREGRAAAACVTLVPDASVLYAGVHSAQRPATAAHTTVRRAGV
eukprot:613263-Rhodomonas_salina.2